MPEEVKCFGVIVLLYHPMELIRFLLRGKSGSVAAAKKFDVISAAAFAQPRGGPDCDRDAALRRRLLQVYLRRLVASLPKRHAQNGPRYFSGDFLF